MFEAERLNENPVFQEYVKLKKIWVQGQQMENLIRQKMLLSRRLIADQKRKMDEEKNLVGDDSTDLIDIDENEFLDSEMLPPVQQKVQPQLVRGRPPQQQAQSQQVRNKPLQQPPVQQPQQQKSIPQQGQQDNKQQYNFTKDELGIDDLNIEGLPEFEDDN